MPIHILSPEVASQIAAGEVVERPASVVKELLENALDARASQIKISVEGAGQRLIEVADDGCGIPVEELPLAVERHATSKLNQAADLFNIQTLGFRGEALASIGSVSRLTLTSRAAEATMGAVLRVEGGGISPIRNTGAPVGTLVRVEDLFYNVPARLKFLKHENTERRLIDNLVTRYALAYPRVRFHLTQEGRASLQTSGNGDRREVLAALYGAEAARQMLEVLYEDQGLKVNGFISPTSITRSNRREIHFFINGRPVQDAALAAALLKGYHTLLMVGRYPVAVLFLEMPPEIVDVNVHPAKAEVRFRNADQVFSSVQNAVRRALLAYGPVPAIQPQLNWATGAHWRPASQQIDPAWQWAEEAGTMTPDQPASEEGSIIEPAPFPAQAALPNQRVPLLRPVGQIANAYLVAEGPDGLYLVDQHAAHERVLFERFLAQRSAEIPSQALLQPATVELPSGSARLLAEQLPVLSRLGFQVESFGPNTFLVRAIPALLAGIDPGAALRVLVEDFEEDETPLQAEMEARLIARVCKRAAVKAGKTLSAEEQRALLLDLEACQSPRSCPHGRPTMIHLSVDLLERQFGRKGAR
ncbi:MAG: DNA mismatch repair endonuclease MutL [Anaerolineales bacterium]|nr:DNA mismatch repair endonuclease MutL [Anaerolineales bacterium]